MVSSYRHRSSGGGPDAAGGGEARCSWLIADDHIDCRLNLHYSLDVIFRLSFLATAREGFWASN